MKIRLADENGEEILEVETLVEGIEDFELKTGLLFDKKYLIKRTHRWRL